MLSKIITKSAYIRIAILIVSNFQYMMLFEHYIENSILYLANPSIVSSKVSDTSPQIISYDYESDSNKAIGIMIKLIKD